MSKCQTIFRYFEYFRHPEYKPNSKKIPYLLGEVPAKSKLDYVEFDSSKRVMMLRNTIYNEKKNTFSSIDRNDLILWKVDIPFDCENDKLKMLDNVFGTINIKKDLDGEEMLPGEEISKYLKNSPPSSIHILVQPPSSPAITDSLVWSMASLDTNSVVSNVDVFLSTFRGLFTRCCNEKLELPIFKPDKAHPYYNAIRDLQIPSNPKYKQRPFLLMNDLPTINGNDGITDTTFLEELSQIKECLIVLGTSGSGKTRTLIELLCKKYGFYFTGLTKENPGSGDLSMMINHLLPRLKGSLILNDAYAMRYSKYLLFARIYTLNYILINYGKICPYNWAILQLCPTLFFGKDIFEEMTLDFRKVSEHFLDDKIRKLIHNILYLVNQKRLPVILDEAQELIDQFHNKFTSTTDKYKSRPLYSVVIRAFTISGICVIPSGTGLTMKSVLDITGSHMMKGATWNHEDLIVIKNGFDSTDVLRNFLSKFGFPFDDHHNIMQWFIGRVRFATTFVEEWLSNNYDIDELFTEFKEYYTDPSSDKSIMVKIVNRTNKDTIRQGIRESLLKEGACELDITSLLERAVLKIWYNGINAIIIKEESALELFEYGIGLLHKSNFKLQISISEPFVIESALRYFKMYKDISLYILDQMANVDFSPSSMGILWENLIPNAIIKLFQNEDVHDIFKKPLPYNKWKIYEPPKSKPYVLAMHSTSGYNLPNFLENPISSFFYPENNAGPDVVTVVCPVDSDMDSDKKYLVLIQAKFREKNEGDILLTTNPKKFYHTRPKKKGEKDKLLDGLIYKDSYDKVTKLIDENYDGIFRIFISYPATVKLQEEKEVDTIEMDSTVEEWTAIIDASNCNRIFDQYHINMFNKLKQPKKREYDSQLDLNSSKKLKLSPKGAR